MSRLASRSVYRRPKSNRPLGMAAAIIGGLIFTYLVFSTIPLMQRLEKGEKEQVAKFETFDVDEPPEEPEIEEEEPPEEEPPEAEEEPQLADAELDLPDIPLDFGVSAPGKSLLTIKPNFNIARDGSDFGSGDLNSPPRATSKPGPRYPPELLKQRIQGKVVVLVTVDERGQVVATEIKKSSGHAKMDTAALNAAKRWKFKPGVKDGRKAVTQARIPFNFTIK